MGRTPRLGVQDARNRFPSLLAKAEQGGSTVITRHGRSIAAIVPAAAVGEGTPQSSLLTLAGSGRGLWGRNSTTTLRGLRDEWSR